MQHQQFSPKFIRHLRSVCKHHPHPRVRQQVQAVLWHALGFSDADIARALGVTGATVRSYLRKYARGGLDALLRFRVGGRVSGLAPHTTSLEEEFRQRPPTSAREAAQRIEALTGVHRSPSPVRAFMLAMGMKCRKVAPIPAKADPDAQEAFITDQIEPRIAQAQAGLLHLFFVDAAHFVFGAYLGSLWCFVRVFVQTPSGRQRFNVLGALHAITREIVTVTNTGYINSRSVVELLEKLAKQFPDHPITLILDNARYQRCQYVFDAATRLGIELLFLPPYSPNLNLIERLWKFTKAECLNSHYYATFSEFCQAITTCLHEPNHGQQARLRTLLTLKFQRFPKAG